MQIKQMRWGYDGGGFACGPMEGNTIVELMVTDNTGKLYFLMESKMGEYEQINVSETPLFDLLMGANMSGVDWDNTFEKIRKSAIETYDYEEEKVPEEEFQKSRFQKLLLFLRKVMTEYYEMEDAEEADAGEYIQKYLENEF